MFVKQYSTCKGWHNLNADHLHQVSSRKTSVTTSPWTWVWWRSCWRCLRRGYTPRRGATWGGPARSAVMVGRHFYTRFTSLCSLYYFWSSKVTGCVMFHFIDNTRRVPLMRYGRQWCGIIHYYWWTTSIKPRLLSFPCKLWFLTTFPFSENEITTLYSYICLVSVGEQFH